MLCFALPRYTHTHTEPPIDPPALPSKSSDASCAHSCMMLDKVFFRNSFNFVLKTNKWLHKTGVDHYEWAVIHLKNPQDNSKTQQPNRKTPAAPTLCRNGSVKQTDGGQRIHQTNTFRTLYMVNPNRPRRRFIF